MMAMSKEITDPFLFFGKTDMDSSPVSNIDWFREKIKTRDALQKGYGFFHWFTLLF